MSRKCIYCPDLCDTREEALYRKRYFDQPSWDDVDRSEDIKMDRRVFDRLYNFKSPLTFLALMNVE